MTAQVGIGEVAPRYGEGATAGGRALEREPAVVFLCICGLSFREREPFDAHMRSAHAGSVVICEDCGRVLPKGQWRVDGGAFHLERTSEAKGA